MGAATRHRGSRAAREYLRNRDAKVVPIDGETLADYVIEGGLRATFVQAYEIKRLESDFFEG